jgi:AcrR family transcriptional regulator
MIKLVDRERSRKDSPKARLAALPADRQAKLLDPAEDEFVAHGFEGASLNRILSAAGMSKGQAYYYVADKADLYRAVIERSLQRLAEAIDASFPEPTTADEFWQQIATIFERLTVALQKDDDLAVLARGIYESPGAQAALTEPLAGIRAQSDRLIAIGQSVGAIRTDVPQTLLADVLFAAAREIDRWFAAHWPDLDKEEALRINDKAVGMIAAMAAPMRPR